MNNLIAIKNENGNQVVSAKELYQGLGLAKDQWSRWYKTNIVNSEFFHVGHDFVGVRHDVEGNEMQDFAISIEFAKHIAMMARTEKSHEYRNYFIKCEQALKEQKPSCIEDVLIQSLQEMKAFKQQLNEVNHRVLQVNEKTEETKQELQSMRDVYTLNPNSWRTDTTHLINAIAKVLGGFDHIKDVREETYKTLDERAGARLGIRLTNMKKNVLVETGSKAKSDKVSKLDVIAADKRLIEVYCLIVKEMAIKYKAA